MHWLYKRTGLYLTLLLSLSGANIFAVSTAMNYDPHIFPGVHVQDVDVGGLTLDESQTVLKDSIPGVMAPLRITFEDKQWLIRPEDLELSIDVSQTAQAAYWLPRQGHLLRRFIALHTTHDVRPVFLLNDDKLASRIKELEKDIYIAAKSASIQHGHDDSIVIIPETMGRELDDTSLQSIKNALLNSQSTIAVAAHAIKPRILEADLRHINGVLAEYRTDFNAEETARNQNIRLAADSLNATLLRPGDILSFNAIVGPRSEERGYRKAPAYINEKQLVDDWGGGICQVSSTLYNAALLADLTIVERTAHFRPAGYVPIGFDATIDFASNLDLKIKNSLPDSVYISIETTDDQLSVKVFGKLAPSNPIVQVVTTNLTALEPKTIIIQDATLNPGTEIAVQPGQKGFHVSTARIRSANGQELSREALADDTYNPVDKIVRVGVKTIKTK